MGQGASSPNGHDRTNSRRASIMNGRTDSDDVDMEYDESDGGQDGTTDATTTLRRSRRLRNHLTHLARLGNRLMPNSANDDGTERTSRRTLPRIRERMRFLGERSSPPRTLRASPQLQNRASVPPDFPTRDRPDRLQFENGRNHSRRPSRHTQDDDMDESQTDRLRGSEQNTSMDVNSPFRARVSRVRSSLATTLPNLPNIMDMGSRRSSRVLAGSSADRSRRSSYMDGLSFLDDDGGRDRNSILRESQPSTQPSQETLPSRIPSLDMMDNPTRTRPGEDQATMLSRLLSVAAAMTAASLVGSNEQALSEARDVGGDNGEGGFDAFLRALQNGRLAAALRNGGNEMGGGLSSDTAPEGNSAPLNFFRMFRFGASPAPAQDESSEGNPSARMVPVIIVGIRSVPPRDGTGSEEATPPIWDALANLPLNIGNNHAQRRNRLSSTRRRGSTGTSAIEANRTLFRNGAQSVGQQQQQPTTLVADQDAGSAISDSRASDALSNTTPNESTNQSPHIHPTTSSQAESQNPASPEEGQTGEGTGSSRRPNSEGTRSWIIYVLGGSYPENHPILTTPSLFTDSPTYEDMMMLSSLIGPAKPPVASQEDVETAGGLFVIGDTNTGSTRVLQGERCLVCLSDYEMGEQCRELTSCHHIFHRECIDEWLTTGRNSCPLCRGQGVLETKKAETDPAGSSATADTAATSAS
ncbi:hypothetical protein BJ508DRAFT_60927 [Ascobolus immersus RN42]|uniref:RING-type domain-containing protein n=1 Tax=Ascobolus immersus RN42 TaxID=1160509 RepID=A0A3N4J0R7_ASCIM|nr:hypothetical protein BJ508DRAFT_60927 [Ascobolus immersus RN42]